jgi:cytochrome c553
MIGEAKSVTDSDLASAAAYFAAVPTQHWVDVMETDIVPKTRVGQYDWVYIDPRGGTEPIEGRIIEVCRDMVALGIGDPRVVVTDYVPTGSIAKGAALAHRPNASGQTCATCHGESMQGTPLAPPLAGNYASYLARTMWDIKSGARQGPTVTLMKPAVDSLTPGEITQLSAYLASLPRPKGAPPAYISPLTSAAPKPKN